MTGEILQKARDYEEKYSAFIPDKERPAFHLTPRVGWMNDPNGFSVYNGRYHLFYQYNPYSVQWGPMHWGHVVSDDLLYWEYLPAALAPDQGYDKDGCFSGSAIEMSDGKQLLMYTGVQRIMQGNGVYEDIQTQCLAIGDGLDYEKLDINPVLSAKDLPVGFSRADFRDPKLFPSSDGGYDCVVGNRTDDTSGAVLLFHSDDGFDWHFVTILDRCYNEYGKMWECPDFFMLEKKGVIMVSPQEMSAVGMEFHNGNCTMFLMGRYDEQNHRFERESVQAVDYGLDFYAPQTLAAPDGRRIMIAWMQNWDTCGGQPDGSRWFGQMTIPRELSLRDGRIVQNPVRELKKYHGRRISYTDIPVQEEVMLQGVYGRTIDMTVKLKPLKQGSYRQFHIKIASGSQHYTSVLYYPETSVLRLSRSHSGFNRDFVHERECFVRDRGGEIKFRIILDRFSVELFVNDGEQAMSVTIFTPQTADGISFEAQGKVLMSVEKYDLLLNKQRNLKANNC